jgi:hypothetical protein
MNAPAKRDILREVDELQLEIIELRGVLQVCRSAAQYDGGDAPDDSLPDALSGALSALQRIEERAKRVGAAAIEGAP